ncbi:hypothetical protein GGE45_005430 [Rhizobium aethiopicum]|uniref:hypothetical protein n=1 Tax=Rhizobium aethiopicum TaxID=1138170 RepID=UPI00160F4566|nr:hypothetical protein [Rhizobium aethiopicum]MBB4583066.1 hypothetical protein [Rhizobium aethiopicum]
MKLAIANGHAAGCTERDRTDQQARKLEKHRSLLRIAITVTHAPISAISREDRKRVTVRRTSVRKAYIAYSDPPNGSIDMAVDLFTIKDFSVEAGAVRKRRLVYVGST